MDVVAWLRDEHARRAEARLAAQREADERAVKLEDGKALESVPADPAIQFLFDAACEIERLREREAIFSKVLRDRGHSLTLCRHCGLSEEEAR